MTVDCASDASVQLSGRLLIRNPVGVTCQLEAAQASMLELINQGKEHAAFLYALLAVCALQQH